MKTGVHKKTCMKNIHSTFTHYIPDWKQCRYPHPPTEQRGTFKQGNAPQWQRHEPLILATTWMDLKNTMLCDRSLHKEYILYDAICKSNLQWEHVKTVIVSGANEDTDWVGRSVRELSEVTVMLSVWIGVWSHPSVRLWQVNGYTCKMCAFY